LQPWFNDLVNLATRAFGSSEEGTLDFSCGEELWSSRDLRMLDEEGWIGRNWHAEWEHTLANPLRKQLCQAAIKADGPIMELAAGAGGGNLSPLLHLAPQAKVIVNDLEGRIVERWQSFLGGKYPNVVFAAFDACSIPFKDGSLGCVSSRGGISNCRGSSELVLGECARVLRPDGLLVIYELCLSPQTVAKLPQGLRTAWAFNPWLYGDWSSLLKASGFAVLDDKVAERKIVSPQESAIAYDASQFGIEIEIVFRGVIAECVAKRAELGNKILPKKTTLIGI